MKRKAILIGNTRNLSGTPLDMANVANHLTSYQGGGWLPDEFEILVDKPAAVIVDRIDDIRKEHNDFVIVYFTGHGLLQGNTITEVNPACELMDEEVLFDLAERQINILDCCRGIKTSPLPVFKRKRGMVPIANPELDDVRSQYDNLITNECAPQFVRMYSCSANESSYCYKDGSGSYYTKILLDSIADILKKEDVARVYACHDDTAIKTSERVLNDLHRSQNPIIVPAKCAAVAELVLGFNPKLNINS